MFLSVMKLPASVSGGPGGHMPARRPGEEDDQHNKPAK
jgi:hypothetical protein